MRAGKWLHGNGQFRMVRFFLLPNWCPLELTSGMPPPRKPPLESTRPISFREWQQALASAELPAPVRESHRRAILGLLSVCKQRRAPVTVALIREYLATPAGAGARDGLSWFHPEALWREQVHIGAVGGVGGGGGFGRVVGSSDETCHRGAALAAPTSGTNADKLREAGRAVAGVGDLHGGVDPGGGQPPRSEGRALVPLHHSAAKDPTMA